MEEKLLFFDIDGTLISERTGEIPESTKMALEEAKKQGHLLFVNTGRTCFSIPEKIKELNFDGYVCGCGTYILYKEKELLAATIPHETCQQITADMRKNGVIAFYEGVEGVYFDLTVEGSLSYAERSEKVLKIKGNYVDELLKDPSKTYDKIFVLGAFGEKADFMKQYFADAFDCIDRGNGSYEVVPKGYSKATGIAFMCEFLGKGINNCYVFGDSENDRAMLEAVPNSIGMGNSQKSIIEICSYITDTLENDGIYKAMKHFQLIS